MERKNTGVSNCCDRVTEKMWKAVEVLDYTRRGSAWYIVRE